MKCVIVAHPWDSAAHSLVNMLRSLSIPDVVLVYPEWLGQAQWLHTVDRSGRSFTRLKLHNGTTLESSSIGFLWNRCSWLPLPQFSQSTLADRNYADSEFEATFRSFLAGLRERSEPQATPTRCLWTLYHRMEWTQMASACGLQVDVAEQTELQKTILITPTALVPNFLLRMSEQTTTGFHQFAKRLGFRFLQVTLSTNDSELSISDINPCPPTLSKEEITAVATDIAGILRYDTPKKPRSNNRSNSDDSGAGTEK